MKRGLRPSVLQSAIRLPAMVDADPRHRNLLRRNLGRGRRGDRRRGEAVGDPLQRRRLAGRDPSRVGRRRARARVAPAHPRHLRRRRARAGRRRSPPGAISAPSPSRRARAWSARCSSACRSPRRRRLRAGLPLVAVHHLAGHIESLVLQNGELPLPAVVLVVSGGHTSLYLVERPGTYQLLEPHARRCGGRGVRQGRQAARPRLSGRAGDRSAREDGQRPRGRAADDAPDARRSKRAASCKGDLDFSFSGLKTAVLRYVRSAQRTGRCSGQRDRRHLRRASSASSSTALLERLFDAARRYRREERRHRRRRLGQQPAARRAAGARRARARSRRSCRASRCRPTTPR